MVNTEMEKTDLYVKKRTGYQISDGRKKKLEPDSKTKQLIQWKIEKNTHVSQE
jgi:hypothetical protein